MNLYSFHTDPDSLLHADSAHDAVPHIIWDKYRHNSAELQRQEGVLAKDPKIALMYAYLIKRTSFPAGEAAIAQDAKIAYLYAADVLKGRFPAGEAAIATDAYYAAAYAKNVLKGPFPGR